jgi:hypothetical protein
VPEVRGSAALELHGFPGVLNPVCSTRTGVCRLVCHAGTRTARRSRRSRQPCHRGCPWSQGYHRRARHSVWDPPGRQWGSTAMKTIGVRVLKQGAVGRREHCADPPPVTARCGNRNRPSSRTAPAWQLTYDRTPDVPTVPPIRAAGADALNPLGWLPASHRPRFLLHATTADRVGADPTCDREGLTRASAREPLALFT